MRLTMSAINQRPAWIWGKMTPVLLQITDTDVAHHLKRFANEAQHQLRRELREKAIAEGVHACFKQGIYEILRVTSEALKKLKHFMDAEQPRTLQAGLGNDLLSYRPDFATKTLVKATEQPWAKGFTEGNHQIKAEWAKDTYNWFDENGIPSPLPWNDQGAGVSSLGDMEEQSYHGPEGATVKLKSLEGTDEQEVKQFQDAAQHLMERVRGRAAATGGAYDRCLSTQATRSRKTLKKSRRDEWHMAANRDNFHELQKRLKVASRRQVLESIVPQVGKAKDMSKAEVKTRLRSVLGKFSKGLLTKPRVRVSAQATGYKRMYAREGNEKARNEVTGMSTLVFENAFHTVEIPSNLLRYSDKFLAKRELWQAKHKTRAEKQVVLEMASVVDPVSDSRIEPVTKDTPKELSTAHVDLWSAILEATFGTDGCEHIIARPDVSWNIATMTTEEGHDPAALLRLLMFLAKVVLRHDKVLFPLRNLNVKSGHFALLTILKGALTHSWHYRDSLTTMSAGNLQTADTVLDAVRRVLPPGAVLRGLELWPSRENVAKQDGLECAAHVCHYLEEEEGPAAVPWPGNDRIRAVREKMRDAGGALDNEHVKWAKDEGKRREKALPAVARFQNEARRLLKLQILSDSMRQRAEELAQKLANENCSDLELPLPENYAEALQKMMDEKAEAKMVRALRRSGERAAAAEAAFQQSLADKQGNGGAEGTEDKVKGGDKGKGAAEGQSGTEGTADAEGKGGAETTGAAEGKRGTAEDKGCAEGQAEGKGGDMGKGAAEGQNSTEGTADAEGKGGAETTGAAEGKRGTAEDEGCAEGQAEGKGGDKGKGAAEGQNSTEGTAAAEDKGCAEGQAEGKGGDKGKGAAEGQSSTEGTAAAEGKGGAETTGAAEGKHGAEGGTETKGCAEGTHGTEGGTEGATEKAAKAVLKAERDGPRVCSKCRWSHGCHMCDGVKSLRYWLHREGFIPRTW
ncbi:unnamed protein product [Prorocentrum cordatum]|uniref:Uncharacterized protein n=1 Tax=Prorocentrum cordatum TaxID=2364126 RepID=A0ABN9V0W7_9DINO|nr:unnamed protein product [Polarella glacialis]